MPPGGGTQGAARAHSRLVGPAAAGSRAPTSSSTHSRNTAVCASTSAGVVSGHISAIKWNGLEGRAKARAPAGGAVRGFGTSQEGPVPPEPPLQNRARPRGLT
jgi:hypothetical protein